MMIHQFWSFALFLLLLLQIDIINGRQYPKCPSSCTREQPTCACSSPSPSDCLQFDPSMYATTIDEALYNFPNLVGSKKPMFEKQGSTPQQQSPIMRGSSAQSVSQDVQDEGITPQIASYALPASPPIPSLFSIEDDGDCSSIQCRSCKLSIVNGFLEAPLDAATNASLWATKQSLEESLRGLTPHCPSSNTGAPFGAQGRAPFGRSSGPGRGKRANSILDTVGSSTTISCDYRRGNPVSSSTRFCGLCSLCWGWRQLPDDYYPQYLNEIQCASDTQCLQGFGQCNQVTRSINVLRKKYDTSGAFRYEQTTIDTVTSCECQVEYGSTIFNLVYSADIVN